MKNTSLGSFSYPADSHTDSYPKIFHLNLMIFLIYNDSSIFHCPYLSWINMQYECTIIRKMLKSKHPNSRTSSVYALITALQMTKMEMNYKPQFFFGLDGASSIFVFLTFSECDYRHRNIAL